MKHIESFMLGKTGIDILNSAAIDIKEISNYIETHYVNFLDQYQPFNGDFINTLYDYYIYLHEDSIDNPWQVLIYEKELRCFNAYRGMSAETFRTEHWVLTADEILERKRKEITEEEMDKIFYG